MAVDKQLLEETLDIIRQSLQADGGDVELIDVDDEGVLIAVSRDGNNPLHVAGGFALAPDFLTAARPEDGAPLGDGQRERLGVHVGEGQDFLRVMILYNGGNQAVGVKFESLGIFSDLHVGYSSYNIV